jgi:hypothetical protein
VTYQQFLNGVETKAAASTTVCKAGHSGDSESSGHSNCHDTYVSGTYTYPVWYSVEVCTTDSKGNTNCHTEMRCCHYPSANIYTPYATRETTYSIESSFGFKDNSPYHFPGIYLDADPKPYSSRAIPSNLPRGAPADWLDAKAHLDAGDPRPVTAIDKYDNYILASKDKVLNAYSNDIGQFKTAGLLPPHTAGIMSDPITGPSKSQADKLSFVDVSLPDEQAWQAALMRYNAALGLKLQGDLHVVMVDASRVPADQSVPYLGALKAYWQGPAFGKRALAKNGIILVMGISDNSTIEWAEASTGMPYGNEQMEQYIHDFLPGTRLDPKAVFGVPRTVISGSKATVTLSQPPGTLGKIMFQQVPFKRASMSCQDKDCVGFKDLLGKIEPTKTQKTWMVIIIAFLSIILWFIVGATDLIDPFFDQFTAKSKNKDDESEFDNVYPFDPWRDRDYGSTKRKGRNR